MSKSLADYLAEVRRAIPIKGDQADAGSTAPINEEVDLSTYRPLEEQERAVIAAMLCQSGLQERAFLPQLDGLLDSALQNRMLIGPAKRVCGKLATRRAPDRAADVRY